MPDEYIVGSLDFGASNSKLILRQQQEGGIIKPDAVHTAVIKTTRTKHPNGYICENTDAALNELLRQLMKISPEKRKSVNALVVTSHGSSNFICLDNNGKAVFGTPSYDHPLTEKDHDAFYKAFGEPDDLYAETGTPNLPNALNWAKLLFHKKTHYPEKWKSVGHIVPLNIYVGSRLCGSVASEHTQTHNHGYGEDSKGNFSSVIAKMGIREMFPAFKRPYDILGQIDPEVAGKYGFSRECVVVAGGHDSSVFALIPEMLGFDDGVSVSAGTWDVIMAERKFSLEKRLQKSGVLYNSSVEGRLLRTVLFRGGSMRAAYLKQYGNTPNDVPFDERVLDSVLASDTVIKPAYMEGFGPYPNSDRAELPASLKGNYIKFHHALAISLAIQRALAIEIAGKTKLPNELSLREFRNARKETVIVGGTMAENYKSNGKDSGKLTVSMEALRRCVRGKIYRLNFPEPTSMAAHILGVCALEGIKPAHIKKERIGFGAEDITFTGDRAAIDDYIDVFEDKIA